MNARPMLSISALVLLSVSALGQEGGQGYSAYRMVRSRNIFDPNRQAQRTESGPPRTEPTVITRSNFIALTGTMVTPGKTLAFFNGSRPEYSKVVTVKDKIADFAVTNISSTQVELELGTKKVVVEVGRQLPLEGSSAATAEPLTPAPAPTESAPGEIPSPIGVPTPGTAPSSAPSPAAPGNNDDVLRRMMERRAKETSK